jgi:hypothetical protein
MKRNLKFGITLAIAILSGLLIAWIDSRPGWDDSGITATLLVLASGLISYFYKSKPIVWGLAVSCWIPILGIVKSNDFTLLLILIFGFPGAFGGFFIHKLTAKK